VLLTGNEPEDFKLNEGTVYLLPQSHSAFLNRYRFNIAINQQSMQEMTQVQVDNYCNLIRNTCSYFYSSNIDQHIDYIVNRTEILKGVNSYLKSKFLVEWASMQDEPQSSIAFEDKKEKTPKWFAKLFGSINTDSSKPTPPCGTDYGDGRVLRMIMKI
jgi:hypothetical protein